MRRRAVQRPTGSADHARGCGEHPVIAAGVFDDDDDPGAPVLDKEFTFGLEGMLDGIDVLVRREADAAGPQESEHGPYDTRASDR